MTMTDPIADMLTRLRNANQAYHDVVSMPYSKMKAGLAEILKQEGYITSYDVADNVTAEGEPSVGKTLTVTLKYGRNRERSIAGVRRISKPGLRVYAKHTGLPKVLGGLGVAIISTSQGLLTDRYLDGDPASASRISAPGASTSSAAANGRSARCWTAPSCSACRAGSPRRLTRAPVTLSLVTLIAATWRAMSSVTASTCGR